MNPPAEKTSQTKPQPIKVASLRFGRAIDIPTRSMTESCSAGEARGRVTFDLQYEPWIRHHRITVLVPGEAPKTVMVHEAGVLSWIPA